MVSWVPFLLGVLLYDVYVVVLPYLFVNFDADFLSLFAFLDVLVVILEFQHFLFKVSCRALYFYFVAHLELVAEFYYSDADSVVEVGDCSDFFVCHFCF